MADEPQNLTLNFKRILQDPGKAPKPAQRIVWTRVGPDFQIDVGFFDLAELRLAVEDARSSPTHGSMMEVPFYVTDRFILTLGNVIELSKITEQMMSDVRRTMKEAGVEETHPLLKVKEDR